MTEIKIGIKSNFSLKNESGQKDNSSDEKNSDSDI